MGLRANSRQAMVLFALFSSLGAITAGAAELTLALANSTCNAMKQVGDLYRASTPIQINYLCKSSGLLAKGLQGNAITADIYVSADREWMDFAIEQGLVSPDKVSSPWGNTLVIAVPRESRLQVGNLRDLAAERVATILIGDPSTAPFGRYTKDALEAAGIWADVKKKIQTSKNTELLADSLARAGPGSAGILFRSNLTDQLKQVHAINGNLHKPIRYYLAPLNASAGKADVVNFLKFLQSRPAKDIFRAERFEVIAD